MSMGKRCAASFVVVFGLTTLIMLGLLTISINAAIIGFEVMIAEYVIGGTVTIVWMLLNE